MDQEEPKPLSRRAKIGIALFFAFLVVFGAHVELRSALLSRRMGDLDVFLRAAWAVRNDADLYAVTSDNDWHYLYPPLYAILMAPLADPPFGQDKAGYVPYAVSVAICYLINVLSLLFGVHVLASALEEQAGWQTQPTFCRRWWLLRLAPVLICMMPVGHTLMRGQVNGIILAMLCAATAGWLRQQNFRAGVWLAFAICIKVIPAFLLVYPLWKRDGRTLLGCTAGCVVGLVLIPGAVFGPSRAVEHYDTYARVFFGPLLGLTDDDRSKEEIVTTDSIGVKSALHHWMYQGKEKYTREMHDGAKAAYVLLGVAMTFVTLWPRKSGAPNRDAATQISALILLMAIFSPVAHVHYLLFCLPMVMCLLMQAWQAQPTIDVPRSLGICFIVFNATIELAYLQGSRVLRDLCFPLFGALPLWGIPIVQMWRETKIAPIADVPQETRQAA